MSGNTHCYEILLERKLPGAASPIVFMIGDDAFLRRETTSTVLELLGIDHDNVRTFDGDECDWIDVHDELATLSLFGNDATRVAVVTAGDKLVKEARPQLEKWCSAPAESSLLVMQLNSLPASTKLFKAVSEHGWLVSCGLPTGGGRSKTPKATEVKKWILAWSRSRHELQLQSAQAQLILDAVGFDSGLLHQELAKLSLYADDAGKLTDENIRSNVGTWQNRTTWEIADAIAAGRATDALLQLERVFAAGEHPIAIIPQISWSLRRYGTAAHLILQARRHGARLPAKTALSQSGFWGNDVARAETQLRRMGLRRASQLLDWLLKLDLKIKGSHSSPSRAVFAIEELCFRLCD